MEVEKGNGTNGIRGEDGFCKAALSKDRPTETKTNSVQTNQRQGNVNKDGIAGDFNCLDTS